MRGSPLSTLYLAMPSRVRDAWGERLPRHLGLWSAIAVLVGSTIGSGIFRVPAGVAERLHEPGPGRPGLGHRRGRRALRGAHPGRAGGGAPPVGRGLRLSARGVRTPPGLPLRLVRAHRHPRLRPRRHRHHLRRIPGLFVQLAPEQVRWVAAAAVLVVGLLNYLGVEPRRGLMNLDHRRQVRRAGRARAARVHGAATAARRTSRPPGAAGSTCRSSPPRSSPSCGPTTAGPTSRSWAGRCKNPGRTLPLALILGTTGIVLVYLLLNFAYIYLVPLPEMAASPLVAATAAERIPLLGRGGRRGRLGSRDGLLLRRAHRLDDDRARGSSSPWPTGASSSAASPGSRPRFQSPSVAIWLATGARRGLRPAERLPAAGRQVHPGHLAVLRPRGGGGVRPAPHPPGHAAALPHLGISGGAGALSARVGGDGGERAAHRSGEHRRSPSGSFWRGFRCTSCGARWRVDADRRVRLRAEE